MPTLVHDLLNERCIIVTVRAIDGVVTYSDESDLFRNNNVNPFVAASTADALIFFFLALVNCDLDEETKIAVLAQPAAEWGGK